MSDNKITQDQLEPNVMEELESGIGDLSALSTENKDSLVAAVTEIYGKSIIADAIGEPLLATNTFNEMANNINDLLVKFKTKLIGNGISVDAEDDFNSLINKLSSLSSDITEKIDIEFVSELPATGENGKLYIINDNELNIVFTQQLPEPLEADTVYLTYKTEDNNDVFSYLVCKYGVFISIIGAQQLLNGELENVLLYKYYNSEFIELKNKYKLITKELDFITNTVVGSQPKNYSTGNSTEDMITHTFSTTTAPVATFSDDDRYFSFNVRARRWYEYIQYPGFSNSNSGISNSSCSVVTESSIDLTSISNIKLNVNVIENTSTSYNIYVGIIPSSNTPTDVTSFTVYDNVFVESKPITLDVSTLSGPYYLGVYIVEKSANLISFIIDSVVLETM